MALLLRSEIRMMTIMNWNSGFRANAAAAAPVGRVWRFSSLEVS